ncbi:MAG: CocE/NonD family hydrolase [Planctomycetota bacterium]
MVGLAPRRTWLRLSVLVFFVATTAAGLARAQESRASEAEKVSRFGEYSGYSEARFDSYVRTSRYLEMRDGVKLAIDVIRPAKDGVATDEKLPCIWTHTRYRRAVAGPGGRIRSEGDSPLTAPLIHHGYNFVAVDVRGAGASFGSWQGLFTEEETDDAYEITEWIAAQPWCDGNVGMAGGSYLGITQLMAASRRPPHLKAIFPMVAYFDLYDVAYHGGVFFDDFIRTWSELTWQLDTQVVAAPVDGKSGEELLRAAIADHGESRPLIDILSPLTVRGSRDPVTGAEPYREWQPAGFVRDINESQIPIYLWCGWFDAFSRDGFLMYEAFTGPRRIVMGAWSHSPRNPAVFRDSYLRAVTEQLRWFDYWLKGIDNGIVDEPPVRYHSMEAPLKNTWRTAEAWPIPGTEPTRYFLLAGPSGSVDSVNDGLLGKQAGEVGHDDYTVDATTTTGTRTRWDNTVGGEFDYPDLASNDAKALTYTTPALGADLDVTGHPILHLWARSTATDGDFFVYLEEVDESGRSEYVTEGTLRASHRKLSGPPYAAMSFLPFHRSCQEDLTPLVPGEPALLIFDLQPTSNVFDAGHRMRLTIAGADADNAHTPNLDPPPTVTILRGGEQASYLEVPVLPASSRDG